MIAENENEGKPLYYKHNGNKGNEWTPLTIALDALANERVFSWLLGSDKTTIELSEECDCCFGTVFNKAALAILIAELQAIHDQMI